MKVGDVVDGKYRLIRLMGEGGMGAVYEVRHELTGARLALKCLHRELATNPEMVQRFIREAQAASAIGNEHIIFVTDAGQASDGSPYLVMEHLDGTDLGEMLERDGAMSPERAIRLVLQVYGRPWGLWIGGGLAVAATIIVGGLSLFSCEADPTPSSGASGSSAPVVEALDAEDDSAEVASSPHASDVIDSGLHVAGDAGVVSQERPRGEGWQNVADRFAALSDDDVPTEEEIARLRRELEVEDEQEEQPQDDTKSRDGSLSPEERAARAEAAAKAAAERKARVSEAMRRLARAKATGSLDSNGGGASGLHRRVRAKMTSSSVRRTDGTGRVSSAEVRRVFRSALGGIQMCYERELRHNPTLEGGVTILFALGARGRVVRAWVEDNALTVSAGNCMVGRLSSLRFPPSQGGNSVFSCTFFFEPVEE